MSDSTSSREGHASGSHFQPSLSIVFIIVVLFIGATFLMVRSSSPSAGTPSTSTTSPTTSTTAPSTAGIVKSKIRVQVANGTSIPSLAAHYTQTLMTQDWDTLPPVNGPHVTATIIYYNPGSKDAALEIATTVGVTATSVRPLGGANPVAGASGDDVIVVLGPNSGIK